MNHCSICFACLLLCVVYLHLVCFAGVVGVAVVGIAGISDGVAVGDVVCYYL